MGVRNELIQEVGAVSKEVVEAMALGAQRLFQTDYAIATSGIAGPDGATDTKPVGTSWIAIAYKSQVVSREYHFGTVREQNIERTTQSAFLILKEFL